MANPTHNNLIECQDLFVQMGGVDILNNIQLTIKNGDFLTLMGPNGAGKSMLIKTMLGIIKPTRGQIIKTPNLRIGYMPQHCQIEPSMPILVRDFLKIAKNPTNYEAVVEQCNIGALCDKFAFQLSGGEFQRVLCARALIGNPQLLILDEPSQNLDLKSMDDFYQMVENIYKTQKITIIMVSHDLHFVLSSSTEVICLYHHICCHGPAHSISQQQEFQKIFGEDLLKKFSLYHHHHDHDHHEHHHHA